MTAYKNLGGNSGVRHYEIEDEAIVVHFKDGSTYRYTYASAGQANIERMKQLAEIGQGLNSFICRVVYYQYASKSR